MFYSKNPLTFCSMNMFPRRKRTFLSFGVAYTFAYLSWLLRETTQQYTGNLAPNTSLVAASTVAAGVIWLAPNMHRHELVRASKEYRECVEHKTSFRP